MPRKLLAGVKEDKELTSSQTGPMDVWMICGLM